MPTRDDRTSTGQCAHTRERHSVSPRKGLPTHAPPPRNLEDVMLREISRSRKINTTRFHLYEEPQGIPFTETERTVVARAGQEGVELLVVGTGLQPCKLRKFCR